MGRYQEKDQYYLPLAAYPDFPMDRLNDPKAVTEFFEGVQRKLHERLKHNAAIEDAFASTILLIFANEKGWITAAQLAVLIKFRVNYPPLFDRYDCDLENYLEGWCDDGTIDRGEYLFFLRRTNLDGFVDFIVRLTNELQTAPPKSTAKPTRMLDGRPLSFWIDPDRQERESFAPPPGERGFAFAQAVTSDTEFQAEFREIDEKITSAEWYFNGDTGGGVYVPQEGKATTLVREDLPKGLSDRIGEVLTKWCLKSMACINGVPHVSPMTVTIGHDDVTGTHVFIPRFYAFSHIENYSDSDFLALKDALDSYYETYKGKPPLAAVMAEARQMRRRLKDQGKSPYEVWEGARKHMGWSETTMMARFGERPQKERNRWIDLPTKPKKA